MEREPDTTSNGINPAKAFAIVAAMLVVAGVTWYLAGSKADTPPTTEVEQPDFSLSDEEAIARFKELDRLNLRAYRERDLSLVPLIYTSDSKVAPIVRKEIRTLRRDEVLARSRFETVELEVVFSGEDGIVIEQEVIVHPKFVSEAGRDLTRGVAERQEVRVTLHPEGAEWLIFDAVVIEAKPLDG